MVHDNHGDLVVFSLEESRANERKLNDEKKNLENYLNNANQQISNLKVQISKYRVSYPGLLETTLKLLFHK